MFEKLINPFRYLSLRQAMSWGIVALLLTSVYCWQNGISLESLTQITFAESTLFDCILRQVAMWLFFSVLLYVSGLMFSHSKVRFVDVASFTMFARIPYDLTLLLFLSPTIRTAMEVVSNREFAAIGSNIPGLTIYSLVSLVLLAWFFTWCYKGFAESTNLKNGRGIWIFALCFAVAFFTSPFVVKYIAF